MSVFTKLPAEIYDHNCSAFDRFSPDRDFRLGIARGTAWLSQLAYETDEPEKIRRVLHGWGLEPAGEVISREVATVLPTASTHAFVAAGRGATFIAFAGTDPVLLANWITDFDTHLTDTGTARGYQDAAAAVRDDLTDRLSRVPPENKLFITGHSLGGALAVITALERAKLGTNVAAVYTFGMPRPGSGDFARDYDAYDARNDETISLGMRTYRLVQGEDLVPTVAPSGMGFRHVGRYLHCPRLGRFDERSLAASTCSDDPPFIPGVTREIMATLHSPIEAVRLEAIQLWLATRMALGRVPPGTRTDLGGILIELLPPRLRDHMPDRYCGALQ